MDERKRTLQLLGVTNQRASHIRLVEGHVRRNSPISVLCPTLKAGINCQKGKRTKGGDPYRPELLVKCSSDSGLQLWMCEGCKDKFLLRVVV